MTSWFYGLTFLTGAVIGSFLNVCIHRLPRRESLAFPGSHCPSCGKPIRAYDNIPILSFLLLRGRCRSCKTRISWQYPLVELLNGLGYLFLAFKFGWTLENIFYALFISSLLVITFIDFHYQIIPDRITYPGIAVGLIGSATVLPDGIQNALIGLALGGLLFYAVAWVSRGGMGGGDIKLIAMIGAFLGWTNVLLTILISSFLGSVVGIFLMLFHGKDRKYPVPFGPFLAMGAILSLFFGREMIRWYLGD